MSHMNRNFFGQLDISAIFELWKNLRINLRKFHALDTLTVDLRLRL